MSLSIFLVLLSLIGFVALQISWVTNLMESQRHRIRLDVQRASTDVAQDIAFQLNHAAGGPQIHPKSPSLQMPDNFGLPIPQTVYDHFNIKDINDKMKAALNKHDAKDIHVEFAIIMYDTRVIEMKTARFTDYYSDSLLPIINMPIEDTFNPVAFNNGEYLTVIITDFNKQVIKSLFWNLLAAALFTFVILATFFFIIRTMIIQDKLNKTKTDFINNMTHELKTPLATISLAVDALKNPKVVGNAEKTTYFSGIIKDETIRMTKHVEQILQAGLMEKQDISIEKEELHVNAIVAEVTQSFELQLMSKNGAIAFDNQAQNDKILGDPVHFRNLINNLIDNAVKYAKEEEPPIIKVKTSNTSKNLFIEVSDNGIGMSKDTVRHVFEKFYRAHTGNVHNVKGFGLGMSYVKGIVSLLKGKIKVESTLGKGSKFMIEIPLASD